MPRQSLGAFSLFWFASSMLTRRVTANYPRAFSRSSAVVVPWNRRNHTHPRAPQETLTSRARRKGSNRGTDFAYPLRIDARLAGRNETCTRFAKYLSRSHDLRFREKKNGCNHGKILNGYFFSHRPIFGEPIYRNVSKANEDGNITPNARYVRFFTSNRCE